MALLSLKVDFKLFYVNYLVTIIFNSLTETNRLQIKFRYKNVTAEESSVPKAISLSGQTACRKDLSDLVSVNSL